MLINQKTNSKIFPIVFTIFLVGLMVFSGPSVTVSSEEFPFGFGYMPGGNPPQVYLLSSKYDLCAGSKITDFVDTANGNSGTGGSRPYIPDPLTGNQDPQTDGCIFDVGEVRKSEYAFTGEQIHFLVAVRDLNGAENIGYAFFTVDGMNEALCTDVTQKLNPVPGQWFDQIPAKPFVNAGFNAPTDKIFDCILTVEPSWYGYDLINIQAQNIGGSVSDNGIAQTWFFNPAIMLELKTNDGAPGVGFKPGYPGQTVMSTNKLMIENLAEGGVDLWAFIAADDLTDPSHSAAKCPLSNVLDIEGLTSPAGLKYGMEYRCKIGAIYQNSWNWMQNEDSSKDCTKNSCLGAVPLLTIANSIIKNQASAECQFRLTYPVPCIGDFTEGAFHVIVRAL